MPEYKQYSKDIWDYLVDMPYMPSRADRDNLNREDATRVQIWDYFFQINPNDVGKPQKQEIDKIEKDILKGISAYTQNQKEIRDSIKRNKETLFWKRIKTFTYAMLCFIFAFYFSKIGSDISTNINWAALCISPLLLIGIILMFGIFIIGWNEKREINNLKRRSTLLHDAHNRSIKEKVERKNSLKTEIKELKKQIPVPPPGIEVRQWLDEHLNVVIEDSKRSTGLVGKDLVKIDPNPISFSGPGELQNPKRFPPTFTQIRASDDINFDIKKHLTARRAYEYPDGQIDVLYGIYYLECILIANDMLATYGLFYDFITGKSHATETTEQYYNDVVSIVVTNEFRWINKSEELYIEDAPTFTMSLSSGESRKVTFVSKKYFQKIKDEIDVSEEDISKIYLIQRSQVDASNAIRALRKQLRLHKALDDNEEEY